MQFERNMLAIALQAIIFATVKSISVDEWFEKLKLSKYDKFLPPGSVKHIDSPGKYERIPSNVSIEFFVESIGNFAPNTMDFDLDLYFIEHWNDYRLVHDNDEPLAFNDEQLIKQLWVPDVYFSNSKAARLNYITVPNYIFAVQTDGTVRYSMRINMKVSCHMDLRNYPIDKQQCELKIQPYGYTIEKEQIRWASNQSVQFNSKIMETDLKLVGNETSYCDGLYKGKLYSCLIVTFHLKRQIGASLLSIYMPTLFIVIISWISFWIDPSSAPARVGLSITTLLTFATQAAGIRVKLPPVSYAKSLDIWFSVCLLSLFGVLLEFAAVSTCFLRSQLVNDPKRSKILKRDREKLLQDQNENEEDHPKSQKGKSAEEIAHRYRSIAYNMDYVSRILFPLIFFIFVLAYWSAYLVNQGR